MGGNTTHRTANAGPHPLDRSAVDDCKVDVCVVVSQSLRREILV
jgi:hypothetical protein